MKKKLEQIVEKILIQQLTPIVEQYLIEVEQKNIFVPSMVAAITPAGQTLKPNSNPSVTKPKNMKDLFRVIKTTPLIVTLIDAGLIDPAELGLEGNTEPSEDVDDEGNEEEVDWNCILS